MSRVTKAAVERRGEIVDAAREMFVKRGFDDTQISEIAKELNVAHGLIYHYFKSKTELLYAVIDEFAKEHMAEAQEMVANSKGTAIECVGALFENNTNNTKGKTYEKLMLSLITNQGVLEYVNRTVILSISPILLSLIERGNADGSWNCRYPKETADFIIQGMSGIMSTSCPAFKDDPEKKEIYSDIIMRLLGVGGK
ncbi:MAG: TetR/AcrR family transcriptional regulator [Clostridiales Family XIII bacterium]|jgi:AcrR family transcriptional regulator|nr:TetR/AcrR family transcriptional regulator [Clostridiales Family XIII bacterium]